MASDGRASSPGDQAPGAECWERHWEALARTARALYDNLALFMLAYWSAPDGPWYPLYEIEGNVVDGGTARMGAAAASSCGDLYDPVVRLKKVDRALASGLISHLGLDIDDWRNLTRDTISREIIHGLESAAGRATFEGTCQLCAGWSRMRDKPGY